MTMPVEGANVQLVVFDLMGTLIEDSGIVARAYDAALKDVGLTPDSDEFSAARQRVDALRGRPTLVVLSEVLGDPVLAEEATWAFDDSILSAVPEMTEIEGAGDVLEALGSQGILLAVTTSFTVEVRRSVLSQMGWTDRFAATLSAHGVRRGHPAPDLLLQAILELRIDSVSQVTIVGDSPTDLVAGNRAGAGLVVGVRSGHAATIALEAAPHTHLIDSVAQLSEVLEAPREVGQRRTSDR